MFHLPTIYKIKVFILLLGMPLCALRAQDLPFPDSISRELKKVPLQDQDSFYYDLGRYYYAFHTRQSYYQAMEAYLQTLKLALKYNHQSMVVKGYFGIGAVYDANNNIEQAIRYYKLHFDKIQQMYPNEPKRLLRAAYNMASIYQKGNDNAGSYIYVKKMEDELPRLKDNILNAHYHLLITHLLGKLEEKQDFCKYYRSLPRNFIYKDGDLAFGRLYAEASSKYLVYEGRQEQALRPLLEELEVTNDSIPLLNSIIGLNAEIGNYKAAYEYQRLMDDVNRRTLDQTMYSDINYRLLEADNILKDRDNRILLQKERQLNIRSAVLYILTFLLTGALLLTWFGFKKFKKHHKLTREQNVQIKKQNAANELMLKEIHHRVKNNLQIISSLIELELTKPSSLHYFSMQEIQIKMRSIALAHQMMYEDLNFTNVDLQSYFEKMMAITIEVLGVPRNDIVSEISMNGKKLNLDRLIPLALSINEMMINTLKHALPYQNPCTITIRCAEENGKIYITYSDNGPGLPFQDLSQAKGTGIRLLRKLAQQMQASISVSNTSEQQMQYTLIFDKT